MQRKRWITGLVAAVACSSAPLGRGDRAALDAGEERLRASVIGADWAALGDLYADSAVLMPPDAPAVLGRNAILSWFGTSGLQINSFEVAAHTVDGTRRLAYVRGTYLLTAAPFGSSQPSTQTGKYVRVWRRDGRAWHIVADIWNTDAAVPEASPGGAHVDNRESGGPGMGT